MRSLGIITAVFLILPSFAHADDCLESDRLDVKGYIDVAISGDEKCMRDSMSHGGHSDEAVKNCNKSTDDRKWDLCAAWACNYLRSLKWTPAC
jgi:hypothetical protein